MKKRISAVLFILALSLTALAGCSGSGGSSGGGGANGGGNSPTPPSAANDSGTGSSAAGAADAVNRTLTTDLTLDQIKANAQAAGYTVDPDAGYGYDTTNASLPKPVTGFSFEHPDLFMSVVVLEYASQSDAQAYAGYEQGAKAANTLSSHRYDYIQGKIVLELYVSSGDGNFTSDKEAQLVSALFK